MFNPVTSLTVTAGMGQTSGPNGNHIVVYDQDENPLSPSDITWSAPQLTEVIITPNATGFFFTAMANAAAQSGTATATYTVNGVTGALSVNVVIAPVTALQFSLE